MRNTWLVLTAVLVISLGIGPGKGWGQQVPQQPLLVSLVPDKTTYLPGDPINLLLTLQNRGIESIFTSQGFMAKPFHLFLQFTSPSGKIITSKYSVDPNQQDPEPPQLFHDQTTGELTQVEPIETIPGNWVKTVPFNARDYYDLTETGLYMVIAHIPMRTYSTSLTPESAALDSVNWEGGLKSYPVTFNHGQNEVDLSITKTAPATLSLGSNLTYNIAVTNNSATTPATVVTVKDTLPSTAILVSTTPSQGICNGTGTVTCNLGVLAPGATGTVVLIVTPTAAGVISNTAAVTNLETDPNSGNNTATTSTTVSLGQPRISGSIVGKAKGTNGYVDLKLTNTGTGHARNLRITSILLRTLSGSGTVALRGVTLPVVVGNLEVGESKTITIGLSIPSTVTRFSITETGTLQNVIGTKYSFSIGQAVIP